MNKGTRQLLKALKKKTKQGLLKWAPHETTFSNSAWLCRLSDNVKVLFVSHDNYYILAVKEKQSDESTAITQDEIRRWFFSFRANALYNVIRQQHAEHLLRQHNNTKESTIPIRDWLG